jgi:hypothetical protein
MRRGPFRVVAVVTAMILLGGCSENGDSTDSTTTGAPAVTTTTPATTTIAAAPTTVPPATSSTTLGSTTSTQPQPTIAPVPGTLALTRVVFGDDPYALITNVGNTPVFFDGQWLASGSRRADLVPTGSGSIEPGRMALIVLGGEQPPQFVEVVSVVDLGTALGDITAAGGELGLFDGEAFTDPGAVLDYVAWGVGPHLNQAAAVDAGIWSEGAAVELPVEAGSISSPGTIDGGVEDWSPAIGG